jgi:DNA-binding transcriptional MerR regulator
MRFSIGEFSRISELTVKSLRLYHEKGILVPTEVDPESGYRYYSEQDADTARSIKVLRDFDFSLAEIKELLDACDDESEALLQLEGKLRNIESKIDRY